jgi:transposase-like protein
MIYRDITHKENLFWSYHPSESYAALFTDLEVLVGLLGDHRFPSGVVSDWKGSIVAAVANFLPNVPHQRCLAHVVREAKRLLPLNSPFLPTRILRKIAKQLPHVKSQEEKRSWLADLIEWERLFGHRLRERTINLEVGKKWWYTHGNLRRAWRLLTDDWYPFFVHLDHPLIPNSNNSLEGVNSQIKKQLGNHRGMKILQRVSFLFWYLSFTRTKSKQDLKKLWGWWKN